MFYLPTVDIWRPKAVKVKKRMAAITFMMLSATALPSVASDDVPTAQIKFALIALPY